MRLDNEYLVADKTNGRLRMLPVFVGGHVNRDAVQLDDSAVRGRYGGQRKDRQSSRPDQGSGRKVLAPPSLLTALGAEVVDGLARDPA